MMDAEQAAKLREPFPKSAIGKLPRGGITLDYVGHAAVCDRLLQVDPTWSWEPFALDERGLPALDKAGNLWIRLTVCGVTRPGVGDGKNAKELISDALRNAAMRFGVALDLWAKEDLHAQENPEADAPARPATRTVKRAPRPTLVPDEPPTPNDPAMITDAMVTKIQTLATRLGLDRTARLAGTARVVGHPVESTKHLTRSEGHAVINAMEQRLGDLPPDDAEMVRQAELDEAAER